MTILGRYLSKMKLKQWREYRWNDTEHLQQVANNKIEQTMKKSGYDRQAIDEALAKASSLIPDENLTPVIPPPPPPQEDYFDNLNGFDDSDLVSNLTDEDKLYLRLKWGKSYKVEEWVQLEQLYNEMMNSYDIQSAGHIDTLKLICKTSLKANQLIDIGDIDGFQKMSKVYDNLMKSGKFTAAQNKAESGEYVDSISELVAVCEKEGFIPRYYTEGPQDKVDYVIQDLQDYTRTLIIEEMHLGALIEKAVKQIEEDRLKELENEIDDETEDEAFERELFSKKEVFNTDQDYSDFADFQEELKDADEDFWDSLREGDI